MLDICACTNELVILPEKAAVLSAPEHSRPPGAEKYLSAEPPLEVLPRMGHLSTSMGPLFFLCYKLVHL